MPPSLPSVLTTVLLKFETTTVLLPVTKKTTLADLKTAFVEALNSTQARPTSLSGTLDESSFQIFRPTKPPGSLDDRSALAGGPGSWMALSDDRSTMSELGVVEAEILGIGYKTTSGSYATPSIEIWRERDEE